jgi:hypothetical protein
MPVTGRPAARAALAVLAAGRVAVPVAWIP